MHTVRSRANVIFFFTLTTLFVTSMLCTLTYLFYVPTTSVDLSSVVVRRLGHWDKYGPSGIAAVFHFDVEADLQDEFNWNMKQIFVFLTAEYEIENRKFNQVTVWDRIITRKEDAKFSLRDESTEYLFLDTHEQIKGKRVNFTLKWDVMPIVGVLKSGGGSASNQFSLEMPTRF